MRILASFLPALTVAILIVIAVLPWGANETAYFIPPLLPLIAIHYWTIRQPQLMPTLFVFLAGLTIDALTNGPLGIWSLTFLIGSGLAAQARDTFPHRSALGRWLEFSISMALVACAIWVISSIYFLAPFDGYPLLVAVAFTTLVYPVIAFLCWPIHMIWLPHNIGPLTRGTKI